MFVHVVGKEYSSLLTFHVNEPVGSYLFKEKLWCRLKKNEEKKEQKMEPKKSPGR